MENTSFYRGAAISVTRFAFLGSYDDHDLPDSPYYPTTQILGFDAKSETWEELAVRDWFGVAVSRYQPGIQEPQVAALSQVGDVYISGPTGGDERIPPNALSPMDGMAQIGDLLYVTGGAGCHFARDLSGRWAPISASAYDPSYLRLGIVERLMWHGGFETREQYRASKASGTQTVLHLKKAAHEAPYFAIKGTDFDNLYLAGQNAALMHFEGSELKPIETGEKSTFTEIHLHKNDVYIAGGHRGAVILKGNVRDGFAPIFRRPVSDLWLGSMCFLGDDIYIGDPQDTTGGLYLLQGENLRRIEHITSPVFKVDSVDGVLWAMEAKALNRFDGERWERFESPYA